MNEDPKCEGCYFLQRATNADAEFYGLHQQNVVKCSRYPAWVVVHPQHFCGEFKPKERIL